MLANNFWGCNMQFGNSQCGTLIRQGISHLLDKVKFSNGEPSIAGTAAALDNPVPSSAGLSPANPCNWDNGPIPSSLTPVLGASFRSHYPADGTAPCVVGSAAGTAYHLAAASGATSVWQPSISDLDFCAAAAYFIDAPEYQRVHAQLYPNGPHVYSRPTCSLPSRVLRQTGQYS